MSLSKQLQKGNIQIKKKNQGGGSNKCMSPMSLNYKIFLQNGGKEGESKGGGGSKGGESKGGESKGGESKGKLNDPLEGKKISIKRMSENTSKVFDIKIIHRKDKKKNNKFTKKPSKINVKDINEIEKQIELSRKKELNLKKELVQKIQKAESKVSAKKSAKGAVEGQVKESAKKSAKGPNLSKAKTGKSKKQPSRNNKKSGKRKNKKGSRKISFKSTKQISAKDIKQVEKEIKDIRSKKTEFIKDELEKEGIKVSGKSKRLLKDIYLYSKMCNIKIVHEK